MTCKKKGGKIPDFDPNGPTPLYDSWNNTPCYKNSDVIKTLMEKALMKPENSTSLRV